MYIYYYNYGKVAMVLTFVWRAGGGTVRFD